MPACIEIACGNTNLQLKLHDQLKLSGGSLCTTNDGTHMAARTITGRANMGKVESDLHAAAGSSGFCPG